MTGARSMQCRGKQSARTKGQTVLLTHRRLTHPGQRSRLNHHSKILKGTRILSKPPTFKVPRHSMSTQAVEGVIIKESKDLSRDQQRAFFSLHNAYGSSHSPFLGIARANVTPLGSGAPEGGLF